MSEAQSIQWFPGHMTKTKRQIEASLKLVDAVAEIIDARIPVSSRNPVLSQLIQNKPRVILMNKCDMADPTQTSRWIEYYKSKGIPAIPIDCRTGRGLNGFIPLIKSVLSDRIASWEAKGMVCRQIRIMVVGIPNVGKSSLINRLGKNSKANVEDRPGVTRSNQWFSIGKGFDLLDTPGVLWPKFEDKIVGERLAFTGAVKDDVVDTQQLAGRLLEMLRDSYPNAMKQRYKFEDTDISQLKGYQLLELTGQKRGMLISGGEIDTERASIMVLDEFRSAKLGRITLEQVGK
ncbi:MAG: ribosome biosis GTPase YlqF [Caproiciproducens sp.]|nr:ribosome biosis GTPase YlqF [Caproiciproducens sp.]